MTQHRDDQLVEVLGQCCELMAAGESIAACLERFPEHAATLEPLLASVAGVQRLGGVPPRAQAIAFERRAQFMTSAHETARAVKSRPAGSWAAFILWWHTTLSGFNEFLRPYGGQRAVPFGLMAVLALVILLGAVTTGAVTASANAIPGDLLYPVKTVAGRARVILARDPQSRLALEDQIAGERLREISSVVSLLRHVNRLPLAGVVEEVRPEEWRVSGLRLLITPQSVIQGIPWVGANVSGVVRAPGDGTLVALLLVVEPLPAAAPPLAPTPTPTNTPTVTAAPPTAQPTRMSVVTQQPTKEQAEPTASPTEPRDTATPTAIATATRTPTRAVTRTPSPTRKPTATWTPWATAPRPEVKRRIIGWVKRIEHGRWTIGEITVDTDAETVFIGDPGVGSQVDAELLVRPDGSYLALLIKELSGPSTTPEPYDFTGVVKSMGGDQWTVGTTTFSTDGDTQIDDGIQVGDWVSVAAERRSGGEIWAKTIRKLVPDTTEFSGRVESINGDTWTVAGRTFKVTANTEVSGSPGVGDYVDVRAVIQQDGSLEAESVSIVPSTTAPPTPTDTPAPPTPTDTPAPPTPTDTPAPPTPTDTALPPAPSDTTVPSSPAPPSPPLPEPSSPTPAPQDPTTP
jgi:hypothetical protein